MTPQPRADTFTRPAIFPPRDWWIAAAVAFGLIALANRAGRQLTFDGYHYLSLAKEFSVSWPDRFGNHWPFGWPLAGGIIARTGLPAYLALVALSSAALLSILFIASIMVAKHPLRLPLLIALGCAAVIPSQVSSVLTELPFAAVLLGLAVSLANTPAPGAWWSAAICCIAALSVRYAGVIALCALAVWTLVVWKNLSRIQRLHALSATAVAVLASTALLGWNIAVTGHASGASRGVRDGLSGLWPHLCDFGWSLPSALFGDGSRVLMSLTGPFGNALGAIAFASLAVLFLAGWSAPASRFDRPLALIGFGYASGMVVLRCVGEFDSLYTSRSYLPIHAVVLALLGNRLIRQRRLLLSVLVVLTVAGVIGAARGASRGFAGDVRQAVAVLRDRVRPGDVIAINDSAFTLSSYLPQQTIRADASDWTTNQSIAWVVVVAKPLDRAGTPSGITSTWHSTIRNLIATGRYRAIVDSPSLVILEQTLRTP